MAAAKKQGKITNRAQLVTALNAGAELEHMLLCSYLYAGFSMRRSLADFPPGGDESANRVTLDLARPWLSQIYLVARQEMDHLGLVCNLLAAVGAEPHFQRPRFPQPADRCLLNVPLCLERFSASCLQRFVWYERPDYIKPDFPASAEGLEEWNPGELEPSPVQRYGISTISELYEEISLAFETLPPEQVFLGDPDRQLGNVFSFRVALTTVSNRQEAQAAIQQILREGEGIGQNPLTATCHFQRFTRILGEYERALEEIPAFDPALPVVPTPRRTQHPERFPTTVIHRPETTAMMAYFDACYHTMLVMLRSFFSTYSAATTPQPRPQVALFYAAFFPLMTMVVRPLGEVLARMPAGDEYPGRNAGTAFGIPEPITLETDLDWYHERLTALTTRATQLVDVVPEAQRPVMRNVHENLTSTQLHLEQIWRAG